MENEPAVVQHEETGAANNNKAKAPKANKPRRSKQTQQSSSSAVTQTLRTASGGATVFVEPEQTFYLVCVPELIRFAARFDGTLRSLSRRSPGHPATLNYFSVFVWCMLAKLARVGVATQQITLNSNEMPDASWCKLPPLLAGIVDSFGRFTDTVTHVSVAPRVTRNLLIYLRTVIVSALTAANAQVVRVAANHRGYVHLCYGEFLAGQIYISDLLRTFAPGVTCAVSNLAGLPRAAALSIVSAVAANNAYGNNVRARLTAGVNVQAWFTAADAARAEVAELLDAASTANFVAEKDAIQPRHTNAADPVPNIAAPALSSLFPTVGMVDVFSIKADICFIESLYACVTPSFSPDGTPSPTVVVSDAGYGFSCSSIAQNLTVQDSIVGALLEQARVFWVTPRDVAYALHGLNQTLRTQTTPFNLSVSSLLSQALADGRKVGAY
jgi:hypothetical protein